jgi:hypothetical protein
VSRALSPIRGDIVQRVLARQHHTPSQHNLNRYVGLHYSESLNDPKDSTTQNNNLTLNPLLGDTYTAPPTPLNPSPSFSHLSPPLGLPFPPTRPLPMPRTSASVQARGTQGARSASGSYHTAGPYERGRGHKGKGRGKGKAQQRHERQERDGKNNVYLSIIDRPLELGWEMLIPFCLYLGIPPTDSLCLPCV